MSLVLSGNRFKHRRFAPYAPKISKSRIIKSNFGPSLFKVGDRAVVMLDKKQYDPADIRRYNGRTVLVEFVDEESEPRYLVRPVNGDEPPIFVSTDELFSPEELEVEQ